MSTANGKVTVEAVINPALYWVIDTKLKAHHIVGIYGITPKLQSSYNSSLKHLLTVLEWWKKDNEKVKALFQARQVEFVSYQLIDGIPFGNLFVLIGLYHLDLRQYLLDTGIAHLSRHTERDARVIKELSLNDHKLITSLATTYTVSHDDWIFPKDKFPPFKGIKKVNNLSILSESSRLSDSFDATSVVSSTSSVKSSFISSEPSIKIHNQKNQSVKTGGRKSNSCKAAASRSRLTLLHNLFRGDTKSCDESQIGDLIKALGSSYSDEWNDLNQPMIMAEPSRNNSIKKVAQGRGAMLKTILENDCGKQSNFFDSSSIISSAPNMGKMDAPGKLKKVFSMDLRGLTSFVNERGQLVGRKEPANIEIDLDASISSSSSTASLIEMPAGTSVTMDFDGSSSQAELSDKEIDDILERDVVPLNLYVDRLMAYGGLIHGDTTIIPQNNIYDMKLHPFILDSLEKRKFLQVSRAQAYTIPAVLSRRSTVLVGPPGSGKSTAVIQPLLSLLLEATPYKDLPKGCGPRAVIIVPFSENVRATARLISQTHPNLITITTCGGGMELERKVDLSNGCDILVSTPKCWLRLLKHRFVTNQKRLCHLFIDQANIVIDLFKEEFSEILKIVENVSTTNHLIYKQKKALDPAINLSDPIEPQIIIVAEYWHPMLENITLKRLKSPLLCMTSHQEAALYARVKPVVHFITPNVHKENKLLSLLEGKDNIRVVIACSSPKQVKILRTQLLLRNRNVLIAHGDLHLSIIKDVHLTWKSESSSNALLIVSDDVLNDLGINNASALVHYSLPATKTHFSNRFSCIKLCFIDRILNPNVDKPDCTVDIMIDEENAEQFPEVISFMSRLGTKIPEELEIAAEKMRRLKECKKLDIPLCKNIVQFGKCWKEVRCRERHIMNADRDMCRPGIPDKGTIHFELLHIVSAVQFSVRLIQHAHTGKLDDLEPLSSSKDYIHLSSRIINFYSNRDNRRAHGGVKIGHMVAVEVETDFVFRRAIVISIVSKDERGNPLTVNIKHIDHGIVEERKVHELLYLPGDLCDCPPQSTELYIAGLLPVDKDISWSYATNILIRKELKALDTSLFLVSDILYTVGGKVLVKDVKCVENLNSGNIWTCHFSVRRTLIDNNLVENNNEHLTSLYNLASQAGLLVPPVISSAASRLSLADSQSELRSKAASSKSHNKSSRSKKFERWAFLPLDEVTLVNFTYASNPGELFVTNYNYSELLLSLEKDINALLNEKVELLTPCEMMPGCICLAKTSNNVWNRAKLLDFGSEKNDEGELLYSVMFVDYGDVTTLPASALARCCDNFITRLPFQAIECELIGLLPYNNGWSDECTDKLYEWTSLADDSEAVSWKCLHVKVVSKDNKSECTGGNHYKILLIDSYCDPPKCINKQLLIHGLANWNPQDKQYLSDEYFSEVLKAANIQFINSSDVTDNDNEAVKITSVGSEVCLENSLNNQSSEIISKRNVDEILPMDEVLKIFEAEDLEGLTLEMPTSSVSDMLDGGAGRYQRGISQLMNSFIKSDPPVQASSDLGMGKQEDRKFTESAKKIKLNASDGNISSTNSTDATGIDLKGGKDNISNEPGDVKNSSRSDCSIIPFLVGCSGILLPQATWKQTPTQVVLNILLPEVKNYHLMAHHSYLYFSTIIEESKCYRLEIELFGPIKAIVHEAKGQSVVIKMWKVVRGFDWPRLTHLNDGSVKCKTDLDQLSNGAVDDESNSVLSKLIIHGEDLQRIGMEKIHLSKRLNYQKNMSPYHLDVNSLTADDDFSDTSDVDETAEEVIETQDPFNPLS